MQAQSELEVRLNGLDLRRLIMQSYLQDEDQDSGYTANPESLLRDAELGFDVTLELDSTFGHDLFAPISSFSATAIKPASRPDSDEEEGEIAEYDASRRAALVGTGSDRAPSLTTALGSTSHPDSDEEDGEIPDDNLHLRPTFLMSSSHSPTPEPPPISRSPSAAPSASSAQMARKALEDMYSSDMEPLTDSEEELTDSGFQWRNSDGSLRVVIPAHRSIIKKKPEPQNSELPSEANDTEELMQEIPGSHKRRHRNGQEALKRRKANRNQKNKASVIGDEAASACRRSRLVRRNMNQSEGHVLVGMSLIEDGNVAKTGCWMGGNPPDVTRKEIQALWKSGEIKEHLKYFLPIPYRHRTTLVLADRQLRIFLYRGFWAKWLVDAGPEISDAIDILMGDDLRSPSIQAEKAKGPRGDHLPVILGYMRDRGMSRPSRTGWHNSHADSAEVFKSTKVIRDLINFVSAAVAMTFPGVKARFDECANWHREHNGIEPEFGLFYNFCINGFFLGPNGSLRVHCKPHADAKNPISVCVLMAWLRRGANYDTRTKSWLVIWEAGVVIELPFWTLLIYPSSLFYHFNVDIEDIKFVLTTDGMPPSKEAHNYEDTNQPSDTGRGSFVWFNMASMFQSSESGFQSLKKAKEAGFKHKTVSDYKQVMQQAFNNNASYFNVPRST